MLVSIASWTGTALTNTGARQGGSLLPVSAHARTLNSPTPLDLQQHRRRRRRRRRGKKKKKKKYFGGLTLSTFKLLF